ncbi:MarR family transcriptional regulator (plasmid) [Ralstonia wenshanensis]|uniref:MarR family winged helix-turn-helix transcriptional regulator n=1 Tax=Ralstonia TaxID=48736 RepID=UPI001E47C30A|nr:MarR family transcriptional regulator [Ralstonia wenshanensis]UGS88169.1 MarR family transcriptional regulator [Ralstonia wenshanensis]
MAATRTKRNPPQPAQDGTPATSARLPYLIGRTDRIVKRRLGEALAPHGLTVPQFTALSVLHARGSLSNAQLAERSFMSPQSANEVVKTMEARGWVTRTPDPTHGRIVMLGLTDEALALLALCDEAVSRLEKEMLQGIDVAHAALLHDLLLQCGRNLR